MVETYSDIHTSIDRDGFTYRDPVPMITSYCQLETSDAGRPLYGAKTNVADIAEEEKEPMSHREERSRPRDTLDAASAASV